MVDVGLGVGAGAWPWACRGGVALPFGACSAFGSTSSAGACCACFYASSTCAISAWVTVFCSRHGSILAAF